MMASILILMKAKSSTWAASEEESLNISTTSPVVKENVMGILTARLSCITPQNMQILLIANYMGFQALFSLPRLSKTWLHRLLGMGIRLGASLPLNISRDHLMLLDHRELEEQMINIIMNWLLGKDTHRGMKIKGDFTVDFSKNKTKGRQKKPRTWGKGGSEGKGGSKGA